MLFSTLAVAIGAFASAVSAQANFTSCCNVTPTSVEMVTRLSWCRAQQNTCPETCQNGQVSANTCDANTLTYNCTCLSGPTGNISDYAQTLPSLECDNWKGQCTAAHPNDLAGQTFCQSFVCGTKNATALGSTSSASASSSHATASATSSGSGTATSSTAASTSSAAAAALKVAQEFGAAGFAFGLFALFGLAL
ncbi:hypothetical protein BLS_004478 [Venturia inaequalis]|uniref:DUF7707 domain-containing protein n=1 Tax=Venturia inaequalis TaxID=5025 RepID=A0A8H3UIF8_VENIN|nr:hypothetical protein BLS_004478 [Venturia inaequalis]KAE9972810.1 hypothetical protein EG328_004745 [Venturia inaequalis]KAE9992501.1 hypothetical protein EG327_008761 [Venturia inaequalis]RDI79565.1 hypothetical protein Vi05172_g10446 [Venturia inaequalis]